MQAAIDKVSALPLDKNGFRGAVLLRAGYYRMATPLTIKASGVVLRGEGMGDTGTILVGTGTGAAAGAAVRRLPRAAVRAVPAGSGGRRSAGRAGAAGGRGGRGGPVADAAALVARWPRRRTRGGGGPATLIRIAGASGVTTKDETKQLVDRRLRAGRRAQLQGGVRARLQARRHGDRAPHRQPGVDRRGGHERPTRRGGRWQPFNIDWDRVVTDVQGNTITVDAPITCAIEKRWGGGEVIKYDDPGRIEKVGIENLRGIVGIRSVGPHDANTATWTATNYVAEEYYSDENHYSNFVTFDNMKNGWVRNATALHFVNSMVGTTRGSKWITVQDCVSREPISQRRGRAAVHVRAARTARAGAALPRPTRGATRS